jgi:hypothetical protein
MPHRLASVVCGHTGMLSAFITEDLSYRLFGCQRAGGDDRTRTGDPLLAKQVLSQLSYIPAGGSNTTTSCI